MSRSAVALSKELLCERTSIARVGRTMAVSVLPGGHRLRAADEPLCRGAVKGIAVRENIDRVLPKGFASCAVRRRFSGLYRGRLGRSLRSRARCAEPDGIRLAAAVRSIFENDSRRANLNFRRKKAAKIPFPCRPADLSRLHYNAIPEPCQAAVFSFFQAYFSQNSMIWNKLGEINEKNMSNARESV